jgi:hypothetical protein
VELDDLVNGISAFNEWPHVAKIRLFGWFLHTQRSQERFGASEMRSCYDSLHLDRPANMSQTLIDMTQKATRELLRDGKGFYLERTVREDFDKKYGERLTTIEVHKLLRELPGKLADNAERAYLDESLVCFKSRAYRAAIVMCWNLAYDHLCEYILRRKLVEFNTTLPVRFAKADITKVSTRDDFTQLKEWQVLEVCRTADIIPPNVYKIMKEKLDKRNLAAHPSGIVFNQLQAEEYISDLIQNAVLKIA